MQRIVESYDAKTLQLVINGTGGIMAKNTIGDSKVVDVFHDTNTLILDKPLASEPKQGDAIVIDAQLLHHE